jgi:hypothetical protein
LAIFKQLLFTFFIHGVLQVLPQAEPVGRDVEVVDADQRDGVRLAASATLFAKASAFIAESAPGPVGPVRAPV